MNKPYTENLNDHIKDKNINVVSFDFFDTLMSRRVAHPRDIFFILGKRLSANNLLSFDIPAERFQALRITAEQRARDASTCKEINIIDIYRQFPENFFRAEIEKIVEMEVDTEQDFLFPSADMIDAVKLANKRGKKVIVVSDIYLDADHLKRFWGSSTPGIDIKFYASSEYKTGKYDKLFDIVIKDLACKPSAILHSGDNYISDCQTPASKGIKTCFLPHGSATFWNTFSHEVGHSSTEERICLEHGDLGVTALRCKVMLHRPPSEIDKDGYVRYGAQILGPVFSPFVHWVSAICSEENIDVVLPLMREGYMIDKLLSSHSDIVSRPAYLSRRVLFQATLTKADRSILESLKFGNLESTVCDYLELIGLYSADTPEFYEILEESISKGDIFHQLLNTIVQTPHLIAKVRGRAQDVRKGVIAHIKTLTKTERGIAKKIALIDVGWNATIQRLLQNILIEEEIDLQVIGLYMMTTPTVNDLTFSGIFAKGFYVDGGYPTPDFISLSRTLEIFEQSCAPSHGSVLQHNIKTGEPTLKLDLIHPNQRADIEDIQEGILLFNELYYRNTPKNIASQKLKSLSDKFRPILRRAMLAPSRQEAELFIDWTHDDNLAAATTMPILGSELSRDFIQYQTIKQFFEIPMAELYWPAGALAIHDPQKSKTIALASMKSLPLDTFDTDLCLSSELAATREKNTEFQSKNHQHLYRNSCGKTYLKFHINVDKESTIRWTPLAKPFYLKIDFVVITYKQTNGLKTSFRVNGNKLSSVLGTFVGVEQYDAAAWRGNGEGCAFYINDLQRFGITSSCDLVLEIACEIQPLKSSYITELPENSFDCPNVAKLSLGRSFIEAFNGTAIKNGQVNFSANDGVLNIAGWMVHSEFKNTDGDFFIRLTNPVGHSQFIPMNSVKRPDVANHLKQEAAPNIQDDLGFSLTNYRFRPGRYTAAVVRKGKETFLVGKETWEINIAGGGNSETL